VIEWRRLIKRSRSRLLLLAVFAELGVDSRLIGGRDEGGVLSGVIGLMKDCIASLTSCCCSCALPSIAQTSSSSMCSINSVARSMDKM